MLSSLHPISPTSDQAVKDLLDHRARASHTRYTSLSFSQRSDSPSIYSRGDFSPGTLYNHRGDWPTSAGYPISATGQDQSVFDDADEDMMPCFTPKSLDRDGPTADDDDCTSFISAPTPRPALHRVSGPPAPEDIESEQESPPTDEGEEDPRMSVLGPKMRFVSRAPWEMGENDLLEEDEEDPSSLTDALSIFGGKIGGWRGRDSDKAAKVLGLSTLRSRSPGPPSTPGKRGAIGTNYCLQRQKISEPQNEGPYGSYLSGASQSHSAISSTLASSSRSSHSITDSLSSDNLAQRVPHGYSGPTPPSSQSNLYPSLPFPTQPIPNQNASYSSHDDSASSFRSESPPLSSRYIHPYANPDLLPTTGPPPSTPLPRPPGKGQDKATEERGIRGSPLRRASESATSPPRLPMAARKTSAGVSATPMAPSRTVSDVYEEDEDNSGFFAHSRMRTSSKPTPISPERSMMTFGDQPGSPMHSLITLEQARVRAQVAANRGSSSSSATVYTQKSNPSSTLVAGLGLAFGVNTDSVVRGQTQRSDPSFIPPLDPPSGPGLPEQRQIATPRPRTMSSGKHMFGSSSSADTDAAPAKTLKHKKSAFMKLFQSGKDKERDRDLPRESISTPTDFPTRAMSTPPQILPTESSIPPLPSVHNIKRVPPPLPLSVVVTSPSLLASGSPPRSTQGGSSGRPVSPPRHRQASSPFPSSNTHKQPANQDQLFAPGDSQTLQTLGLDSSRPAVSAPPTQTNFEALSLRPVSTIFSAKFPDLLCPTSPPLNSSTATTDPDRPNDPSPTTPGFVYSRSNSISTTSDYPITPTSGSIAGPHSLSPLSNEDQSGVIATLQEQIINSRKAWQRQIWELEGQVRDLKAEVEELRNTGDCETCGKAKRERRLRIPVSQNCSVVDRPRPRMGGGARTVFGGGSDM